MLLILPEEIDRSWKKSKPEATNSIYVQLIAAHVEPTAYRSAHF